MYIYIYTRPKLFQEKQESSGMMLRKAVADLPFVMVVRKWWREMKKEIKGL